MRKLLVLLMLCLSFPYPGQSGVTIPAAGDWLLSSHNSAMAGHFPMTVAVFHFSTTVSGDMTAISDGSSNDQKGWGLQLNDTSDCGAGTRMSFVKWHVVGVCATSFAAITGAWELVAVVVTSTNIHFVKIPISSYAASTLDVANASAFIATTTQNDYMGANGALAINKCNCSLAYAVVWDSTALTDAQLVTYAHTCDPWGSTGIAPSMWVPLFSLSSARQWTDFGPNRIKWTEGGGGNNTTNFQNPPCTPAPWARGSTS